MAHPPPKPATIFSSATPEDADSLVQGYFDAYPGVYTVTSTETRTKEKQRVIDGLACTITAKRNGALVGTFKIFQYQVTLHSLPGKVPISGLGAVAVSLLHKKEKVAKEMVAHFCKLSKEAGNTLAMLYPFRPDFYKAMGFGYGTKSHEFRFKPTALPSHGSKEGLRFLTKETGDQKRVIDCFNRYVSTRHGMVEKRPAEWERMFGVAELRILGYQRPGSAPDAALDGILLFKFKNTHEANMLHNDLLIEEWISHIPAAFQAFCSFLHSQVDQICDIVHNTQDSEFHLALSDVRTTASRAILPFVFHPSSVAGVGLMYRILDVAAFLKILSAGHNFNGVTAKIELAVTDTFLLENQGVYLLDLDSGKLSSTKGAAAPDSGRIRLSIAIAELSSLLLCATDLRSLVRFGAAEVTVAGSGLNNEQAVALLHSAFRGDAPFCRAAF